ncbi:MAG TPA: ExeM/NucH family extracellular endonuclease, partial [Pyrinomonadaceae bacterium]|nr:ExeM/NucH family extracellular endonuclease [Pyrinomonadaceae bacterium]
DQTRRAGDTVTGLTGVLTFDFSEYRLQPTVAPVFAQANPRPAAPASVGGTLKAASSNVLNYFNGDGAGGGFPTSRGASTPAEFARQRAKVIAALTTLNADVLGVIEVENDGFGANSALQDLINGMNDATAAGTYAGIDSPNPGTDLIKSAIIYKPASVTPVGAAVNDINSAWDQARPPLAQTFQQNSNGEKFTFIVNHFTSKGCSASDTGPDADTGQGCDNGQRTLQANRLLVFIQDRKTASGDPDVLSMGDYNAYTEEDPMFILEQDSSDTLADGPGGLVSESKRFVPQAERYSFQFNELFGELDHALTTKSLNNQVTGATIWHINSDEPVVIDYNTEFKTQDLYTPTPYRASDHDPLVVGLNLSPSPFVGQVLISEFRFNGPGGTGDEFIELYNNTESDINVQGWTLSSPSGTGGGGVIIGGTGVIPRRGHYLVAPSGYSVSGYPAGPAAAATPDFAYTGGVFLEDGGVKLLDLSNTVVDAVGFASTNGTGFREGTGLTPSTGVAPSGSEQFSFVRKLTPTGFPQDTNVNTADFVLVSTSGAVGATTAVLGAPGPENTTSPVQSNGTVKPSVIDGCSTMGTPTSGCQNIVRDGSATDPTKAQFGTIAIRRKFTNTSTQTMTQLRFRVIDITTLNSPGYAPSNGQADLRVLTSTDTTAPLSNPIPPNGSSLPVQGTMLEEPPVQTIGGGLNSTLVLNLSQPVVSGASVYVQFLLGVQQNGSFRFFVNAEAGYAAPPPSALKGQPGSLPAKNGGGITQR